MRKYRKRLSIDIPQELHEKITQKARDRNVTLTRWVIKTILNRLAMEKPYE